MASNGTFDTAQTGLADLPGEILALVLSYVAGPALVRVGATSTSLLKLTRSPALDERCVLLMHRLDSVKPERSVRTADRALRLPLVLT